MPTPRTFLACVVSLAAGLLATSAFLAPARATPEQISLMQTLEEWKYPGSAFGGASMSDGGNPEIQDLACKAVLTTPDSVADVVKFYESKTTGKAAEAQAVVPQDDSKDRPVAVRIISVHKGDRSNTLVITRGEGEKETHIAWTQYRRLSGGR